MNDNAIKLLFLQSLKGTGVVKINEKYLGFLPICSTLDDVKNLVRTTDTKLTSEDINVAASAALSLFDTISADNSFRVITLFDDDYPKVLLGMGKKKPFLLYTKGNIKALEGKCLAIVGTREPCARTLKSCPALVAKAVTHCNPVIVSGLALGCDALAHTATLDSGGVTVAVLPCGINNITPATNTRLAERILENNGCLISEYPPSVAISKYYFPRRDEIIAGLSKATIALECNVESGTMHTIDDAIKFNRKVAAFMPDNPEGGYLGNQKIVTEGGTAITTRNDLTSFLDTLFL